MGTTKRPRTKLEAEKVGVDGDDMAEIGTHRKESAIDDQTKDYSGVNRFNSNTKNQSIN